MSSSKRSGRKFFPLLFLLILIFVVLVFIKFIASQKNNSVIVSPSSTASTISEPEDLLRKCGDISRDDFGVDYNHFSVITGPEWSPNCKYAVMGVWQSGTGYAGNDPEELKEFKEFAKREQARRREIEGLYLFDSKTKKSKKIYTPTSDSESPEFLGWESKNVLIFRIDRKKIKFNINTQEISEAI